MFDEIALITDNDDFLTHLIFHPIQKSNNRKLEAYTLQELEQEFKYDIQLTDTMIPLTVVRLILV